MKANRHPKRRRITNQGRNVQPDAVVSSIQDSYPPVVTVLSDPSVSSHECSPSTAKDVSTELRKVECPSSGENPILALKQIQRWLMTEQIESSALVLENFYCYGGIARVLDFMESNMDDWDCAVGVASLIADFLSFRFNEMKQSRKTAIELAKMIIRRNGVQLFLQANQKHAVHNLSSDSKHIWVALGRTINGEETLGMIDKDQTICILSEASNCIVHLEGLRSCDDSSNSWTSDVLQAVLYTIANTIKNTSVQKDELKCTGIVESCLRILNENDNWTRNDTVVTYALGILAICEKQSMNITTNHFDVFLPRLIYCMKSFGKNLLIISFVLTLLEIMCENLHKERIEASGVLEATSALLKSETICGETKDRVRYIMRKVII